MATSSPQLAKSMKLKLATNNILNLTSKGLQHMVDVIEVTTDDSGSYKEYKANFKDLKLDFAGIANSAAGIQAIEDLHGQVGTEVAWEYGDGVSGHRKISGTAILLDITEKGEKDGVIEFSGNLQNTGDPTFGTYA